LGNEIRNIIIENLKFVYPGTEKDVIGGLNASFPEGWTGIVGPNGCGKSTLMAILAQKYVPTSGKVDGITLSSYHCTQETTNIPEGFEEFRESFDKSVMRLKASLELFDLELHAWDDMSHGERKRYQLGIALSTQPELLMLDEPTNHLDSLNRSYIIQTLKQYRGIGILVSHDRELLDAVVSRCIIYTEGRAISINGNYTKASESVSHDAASRTKHAENLKEMATSLKRETNRIDEVNKGSKKRLSKRGLSAKDHDAKTKIDKARLTSKETTLSQRKINIERRLSKAREEIDSLQIAKSYADSIFFDNEKPKNKVLLHESAQEISLAGIVLKIPELVIQSSQKIGVTGLNGAGKSSLVNWVLDNNKLKNCNFYFLPQELDQEKKRQLQQDLESCSKEDYSKCLQIIARLGSDAKQILTSESLSSGEIRKIAIALAIVKKVDLLILDEPTNHLDLHSVKHLEHALAQCHLAILMISHDTHFVDAVSSTLWHLEKNNGITNLEVCI
jgi:ATPase subunit of ABC transporter with duplicated ATPase domains